MFLKSEAAVRNEDITNWWASMCSPFADEYWKAYLKEVKPLEKMVD